MAAFFKSCTEFPCVCDCQLEIQLYLVLCSIALAAASHLEETMKNYSVCTLSLSQDGGANLQAHQATRKSSLGSQRNNLKQIAQVSADRGLLSSLHKYDYH